MSKGNLQNVRKIQFMTSYATLLNRGMGNEGLNADVQQGRQTYAYAPDLA